MKAETLQEQFKKSMFDNILINIKDGSIVKNTSSWGDEKREFNDSDTISVEQLYRSKDGMYVNFITVGQLKDWEFLDSENIPDKIRVHMLKLQITNLKMVMRKYINIEPNDFIF